MKYYKSLMIIVISLISPAVLAHTGVHSDMPVESVLNNFLIGLSHPVSGIDHLLVLLLAGFLIARRENKKRLMFTAVILSPILLYGIDANMMNLSFTSGFMLASIALIYSGDFFGKKLTIISNLKMSRVKVNHVKGKSYKSEP